MVPNQLGTPLPDWKPATLPPRETLHGHYCQLRPLEADDATQLWPAIENQPELFDYLPYGPFENEAEFANWLAAELKRDDAISWAICDLSGAIIGFCSYLRPDLNNGSIEMGNVLFSPQLQRTRAATETMFLLMRAVFENGFRRYEWKCNALNAPSAAAAQRLGFTFEGTFRNALVVKGRNRDTCWFSIIDTEWPRLQTGFERWLSAENFDVQGKQIERLQNLHEK